MVVTAHSCLLSSLSHLLYFNIIWGDVEELLQLSFLPFTKLEIREGERERGEEVRERDREGENEIYKEGERERERERKRERERVT